MNSQNSRCCTCEGVAGNCSSCSPGVSLWGSPQPLQPAGSTQLFTPLPHTPRIPGVLAAELAQPGRGLGAPWGPCTRTLISSDCIPKPHLLRAPKWGYVLTCGVGGHENSVSSRTDRLGWGQCAGQGEEKDLFYVWESERMLQCSV